MTRAPRARGSRKRAGRGRFRPLGLAAVAVAAVGLVSGAWTVWGPGPYDAGAGHVDVVVPAGGGLAGTARALKGAGVIRSDLAFMTLATATGAARRLQAGDYEIPARASLAAVLDMIRHGEVARRYITIPEGYTAQDARAVLRRATFLTGEAPLPAEGALLPETYQVTPGESRRAVLQRMATARDALLDRLWRARAAGLPYATPQQAVILASVVEKETALPSERPRIAAVFINRLRKGMRLESDPTVIYGLSGGAPLGHGLTASELASPSPYNTYRVAGLPPTPIANPGRASLAAALDPARTADLFFVADGTGGHVFASTFDAHRANVARWRVIEREARHAAVQGLGS